MAPLLCAINVHSEQVVISEIMYHPPGTLPEYIEVYNVTATPFDMAQWQLRDAVTYDFPAFSAGDPMRTFLKPFERILLAGTDAATLRAAYNIPASVRIFGPWTGALDNAGERITLNDKNGVILCTVAYNDRGKWPPSADGAGHTLVLKNPDRRIDDFHNWTASSKRLGSPGSEPPAAAETPVASPEVNLNAGLPFVNYGDNWRLNDKNIDLGTAWRAAAFDDSSWTNGPGLFGFETAPLPAPGIRTPFVNSGQLTYYARTRFVYNGSLSGITISIDQILDDGAVYYLNGQELGRSGIAAGAVTFTTVANRTTGDAIEELNVITVPGTTLVNGTNVLAAEIHQVNTTSSDVVFGARLKISTPTQPSLIINEVLPGSTGNGFVEIFNPRTTNINLRNHYVTDNPANLTKFRVLTDVIVPAGGLASLGFAESGLAVASPVKVYLVAPDGLTAISAIDTVMPLDGRSIGRKPTGSASWYLFVDPTRNAPNASQSGLAASVRVNEVHFSPTNTVDWVELHNDSDASAALDGLFLASRPDLTDKVALTGSMSVGGFTSRETAFPVSGGEVTLYLVNGADTVLWSRVLARPATGDAQQAFPDGADEWYASATSSRDAANNPPRQTNVVINEIMYDAPSDEPSAEFIELYNRGSNTVDLSGWRFTDGIDFTFANGTTLAPDSYLVVAADLSALASTYGAIPAVGNFEGRLANNGELIRLVDAVGNLADEVDYLPGGNWPRLANGDGTSMELRNPWMDNSLSSGWADSNETNKTTFQTYVYSSPFQQLRTGGAVTDYKELHLHLVGDSHVVLRNIQLRLNAAGGNLLVNSTRMSADSASASGWLAQGTHYATHFEGAEMHLIADGHGDNRPNRVELDATAMNQGSTYEVSFEARWVAGASRLIVQTWDHSIATTVSLPVPRNLGTPGLRNSRYIAQPAAQVDRLLHSPAVPTAGQAVRVTVAVHSPIPSPQVLLYHRLDNASDSGAWLNKPMFDNGVSGGDAVPGDGIYSAQLTEYPTAGQIAQFYVVATANGQSTQLPPKGPAKPALFVVDAPIPAGDLRRMRFVVPALAIADLAGGDGATPPNGYAFPRLANHYFNTTLIINESDVIYDCEIRNGGSPWTRGGDLSRGKYKYPKDQLFRGKEKQTFDNDAAGGSRHHNRIIRHWLYLFGHPANENEFIQVKINNGGTAIREETEPLGNDMMDRIYPDGSQGELYRIDDEWWFNDDWNRTQRDADWSYKGTDNPGRYHSEWMKRTRENDYDYSSLIGLFRKVNSAYTQAEIEQIVDPIATMSMAAIRGYAGDWDSFSLNRGKNGYMYRRSTDGLFMFFHWDSDLAFQNTGEVFYNGMAGYRAYHERPYNLRLYRHFLATLVEQYTRNSPRINAWLQAEEAASTQYTVDGFYQSNWFVNRENPAFTHLGTSRTTVFDITSNGGATINVSSNTINLAGTGPLRVFKVIAVGHPEAVSAWTTDNAWSLTGIRLRTGANVITINAVDKDGNILHTDTITVNKTGNAPPVMALDAKPNSWHVSVFDSLEIDASESFDPDGLPLSYAWAANPSDAQLDASGGDNAEVFFPRPGLYTFTVTGTDAGAATNSIQREAAVYGPGGFSPFTDPRLESFWNLQNVSRRGNHHSGSYYSANEVAGSLVLQVYEDRAYPLASAAPAYPLIWRALPPLTDWAFLTEVKLNAQVFGDYVTGALIEMDEGGAVVRYAFGIEDGTQLTVRRVTAAGAGSLLRSVVLTKADVKIRVRRAGNTLAFDRQVDDTWTNIHSAGLPAGSAGRKAGLFLATDTAQRIKSMFDYAILIDPSATSDLRQSLRFSEIMYNPAGGAEYEFVELVNTGNAALDLTGVRFSQGIDYTFGPTTLGPKQFIVVVKNQALFASRYNASTMNVAPGIFGGRLDNAGETVSLSDSNGIVFLSLTYGVTDPWPAEADGSGSSLEVKDASANPVDPANWRASPEANGSPGRAGGDALGTVIINEALSHTDPPLEDAIEVFNRTAQPLDIGGWFLSDSRNDFKRWRIPDNTIVPALGFRVFYEIDFNSNNLISPFSLSSANGDQIYLSAADAAGNLTGYRSAVEFDAAANGVSFGRYETSVGRDFPALLQRTFGADNPATLAEFRAGNGLPNAAPRVGPVVINEIMYRPPDIGGTNDNSADEFVEIYNVTDSPVSLFDAAFPTNAWRLRGGADFDFPSGITLPPHGYALVANFNPQTNAAALAAFRTLYGVPAGVPIFGPYQGKLNNSGEEVKLTRPDAPTLVGPEAGFVPYILVDKVNYADSYPWPATADGTGHSLQRRRPHDYGNDPVNWKAATPTTGRANVPGAGYTDADEDGMADSFETANGFSTASAADAAQDADSDGKSNYEEFLDGTNPNNAASRLIAPFITTPPQPQTAAAGGSATFTVAADGTAPLSYQWRFNGVAVTGGTNASLVLGNVQLSLAGEYSVVAHNAAGFVISGGASLSVSQPLTILSQPQSRITDRGNTVTFTVFAAGTGPLRYQWRFGGQNIPGAINSSLTLNNVQPSENGNYSVVITDDNGSLTSADATLSVLSPPTILTQPRSQTNVAYTTVFFSVTPGGEGPFTYQWRFGAVPIPDATSSILALPNVQPGQAGTYSVEVFNPVGSVVSANAILTLLLPATITQQPRSTNTTAGATVTFTVAATSSTPITYQWRFNDSDIPGATDASLTVANVQEEDAGNYQVIVTDGIGSVSSSIAVLGITIPLSLVQAPLGQSVVEGGTVTFSAQWVGGPPPFGVEWRKGSVPIVSNTVTAFKSFFTITNVQASDAAGYRVVIRNVTTPGGAFNSLLAQLTVLSDFDDDGMPDVWEQTHTFNTNSAADAVLDADGDTVSNRAEYQSGTDPRDPADYLWVDASHTAGLTTLWFPAMSNKTYTVEFTDFLGTGLWTRLDDLVARSTNHTRLATDPNPVFQRNYRVVTPRRP